MRDLIPADWSAQLAPAIWSEEFQRLTAFLVRQRHENPGRIYPPASEVFTALDLTPYDKVRAVILGMDPYPGYGQAHGLAFSLRPNATPFPSSLRNILNELERDLRSPGQPQRLPCPVGAEWGLAPQRRHDRPRRNARPAPQELEVLHRRGDRCRGAEAEAHRLPALGQGCPESEAPPPRRTAPYPRVVASFRAFGASLLHKHIAVHASQQGTARGRPARD